MELLSEYGSKNDHGNNWMKQRIDPPQVKQELIANTIKFV